MIAVRASRRGDTGSNKRTEDSDEDRERDRERQQSCFLEIIEEGGLELLVDARIAELADEELRMSRLGGGDGREDRGDLVDGVVGASADLEFDQGGAPVAGDLVGVRVVERRAQVLHGLDLRDARDDVLHGRAEGRIALGERGAPNENAFGRGPLEACVHDPVGAARLAYARSVLVDHGGPDRLAESKGDDHEREPAEDCGLAVPRAPASDPSR
jgi:hypothetical protein